MGRLTAASLAVALLGGLLLAGLPARALGFTGFGATLADAIYGANMTFRVDLQGGAPEELELLLRFAGDDATFVAPVEAEGDSAQYVWDTADRHVTPNTTIRYSWRATSGGRVTVSRQGTLLYDDDRPGLDWQSRQLGDARVHWYGGAEAVATGLGGLAADGAARAESLLGHEMVGPVDIFVYEGRDEFFGALGPAAREWTGAATYPQLRTIFMWLEAGNQDYLETTLVHEVTHVVFNDATDNPFHEPAKWFNEGLASWSETQSAAQERAEVEFEAGAGGLFAFEAIAEQFPIGERGSRLAYAQGATMVDMIVANHGTEAIARIADAYRAGASDDEALRAGTARPADDLYAEFFADFDADLPQPVEPAPIPPSDVRKPGGRGGSVEEQPAASPAATPSVALEPQAAPAQPGIPWLAVGGVAAAVLLVGIGGWVYSRRARPEASR
ncbi:MAG TPA: peptidase MA family metallohydrolase [Candidatus Limnocylindria bacterium]|nr:peptidase MA family metallohydrolase [Candidatus Limnocylindria bacterium]